MTLIDSCISWKLKYQSTIVHVWLVIDFRLQLMIYDISYSTQKYSITNSKEKRKFRVTWIFEENNNAQMKLDDWFESNVKLLNVYIWKRQLMLLLCVGVGTIMAPCSLGWPVQSYPASSIARPCCHHSSCGWHLNHRLQHSVTAAASPSQDHPDVLQPQHSCQ